MSITLNIASVMCETSADVEDAKAILAHVFGINGTVVASPTVKSVPPVPQATAVPTIPAPLPQSTPTVDDTADRFARMTQGATSTPPASIVATPQTPQGQQGRTDIKSKSTDGRGMFKHARLGVINPKTGQDYGKDCGCSGCQGLRANPNPPTGADYDRVAAAEQAYYGGVFALPTQPTQPTLVNQQAPVVNPTPMSIPRQQAQQAPTLTDATQRMEQLLTQQSVPVTPATPPAPTATATAYTPPEDGRNIALPLATALENFALNQGEYGPTPERQQGSGLVATNKRHAIAEYMTGRRTFSSLGQVHAKLPAQVKRVLSKAAQG